MNPQPAVEPFGDQGVVVRFAVSPSQELTALLAGLATAASRLPEVVDAAPGLTSVLIELDSEGAEFIRDRLPELLSATEPLRGDEHELPVCYDGADLAWVLDHLAMARAQLISAHSAPNYDVRLIGSPGFVYLSDVNPLIAVPRLAEPRPAVAAGSVGIGGSQAGIYGRVRPGGWRIVATLCAELPVLRPGDRVRFLPQ
ncbi:MAG: 5-oxoprolinase subunit B family protein [Actinomycetota bacterium]